jgi:hypothetical protein
MNLEHYRPDVLSEALLAMLESGELPRLVGSEEFVLTASGILSAIGEPTTIRDQNNMSRRLTDLAGAPSFPYHLTRARKRVGQIDFKPGQKAAFVGHITNEQGMFSCYIVTKKASAL